MKVILLKDVKVWEVQGQSSTRAMDMPGII